MSQSKSKVTYGTEIISTLFINGANLYSAYTGSNFRCYTSEQCGHWFSTIGNERPKFCTMCGIELDWSKIHNYIKPINYKPIIYNKICPQCKRQSNNWLELICGQCGIRLIPN